MVVVQYLVIKRKQNCVVGGWLLSEVQYFKNMLVDLFSQMVIEVLVFSGVDMFYCCFGSVVFVDQCQQWQWCVKQCQMSDESFYLCIGDMVVGMKDFGGDFDQFVGMVNEYNLVEIELNCFFNYVVDEVVYGDYYLWVDVYLFVDKVFIVVVWYQYYVFQFGGVFYFQFEGE